MALARGVPARVIAAASCARFCAAIPREVGGGTAGRSGTGVDRRRTARAAPMPRIAAIAGVRTLSFRAPLGYATRMLVDDMKKRLTAAMKDRDEVAKDVLRVALGEIQTIEARTNKTLKDEEAVAIVRKLVKSNEETIAAGGDSPRSATLRRENEVLLELLPKTLTVAQIVEILAPQHEAIRAAKADGQATGVAMKHMKTTGATYDGADVGTAVRQIRGG
jgi:uncharacterized protein YqeY